MTAAGQRPDGPADEPERVVVRDKRRVDPHGATAKPPAPEPEPSAEVPDDVKAEALLVEERTRDLQRVQAEYANYRKRAERDRLAAGELGVGRALTELLPVLDDIDRARQHGDLTGGLKAIADRLESALDKLGLERFGTAGDPFDPTVHEAVLHAESDDVEVPTCTTIMRSGYRLGERLLRPAMVGVTDPLHPAPAASAEQADAAPVANEPVADEPVSADPTGDSQ